MIETLKGLQEKRAGLIAQAEAVFAETTKRDGKWTGEDSAKYDAIQSDIENLSAEMVRRTQLEALQKEQAGREEEARDKTPAGEVSAEERAAGFKAWARGQKGATDKDAALAKRAGLDLFTNEVSFGLPETRAMGVGGSGVGDKAFSTGFVRHLEVARLAYGAVRNEATLVRTATGNPLRFPTSNDTGQSGALLAENTQVAAQDIAISEITMDAYKYSSKLVLVSAELIQDEEVDLEYHIGRALGERLGRITNAQFTTGTGSSQPNGIVTAATSGKTAAAAAAITYAELVDLQHSVDPEYQDGAKWMFNFSTLATIKKLVDSDGRPIWQPSATSGMGEFPGTILGRPYVINQQMATIAASAKPILYGNLKSYLVREVKDIQLLRLNERYADYHQVGFLAYLRTDGELLNAGTNPVKFLTMAAS